MYKMYTIIPITEFKKTMDQSTCVNPLVVVWLVATINDTVMWWTIVVYLEIEAGVGLQHSNNVGLPDVQKHSNK